MPWSPLRASGRSQSTPGTSLMIFSFSILWSSRPIWVSSSSNLPHDSALRSQKVLMISSTVRRAAMPCCCSCRKASCAAAQASLASGKTPNLPRRAGRPGPALPSPWQRQEEAMGAGAGAGAGAGTVLAGPGAPPRRPITSATISRIKASLTVLIKFSSPGAVDLFPKHIHYVHDADDHGIDGNVLESGGEAGAAALAKHHHLAKAGADAVHRHDGVQSRAELCGILRVHQLRAQHEQLATVHPGLFLGRDHRTFDSGEEHRR